MSDKASLLAGELRVPFSSIQPLPNNERKVIAHRAMLLIDTPHSIVNLGIGVPEVCSQKQVTDAGVGLQLKAWCVGSRA